MNSGTTFEIALGLREKDIYKKLFPYRSSDMINSRIYYTHILVVSEVIVTYGTRINEYPCIFCIRIVWIDKCFEFSTDFPKNSVTQ